MLDPRIAGLARGKNFAALSFRLPDGHLATHIMWVDATDEHLLINTEVDRAKYRAIAADPVVTVTVWDAENPYRYGEVRGRVVGETRGDEARAHIDACAQRYTGADYAGEIKSERVILRVAPERQRPKAL